MFFSFLLSLTQPFQCKPSVYARFCIDAGETIVHTELYKRATQSNSRFVQYQDGENRYAFGKALCALEVEGEHVLLVRQFSVVSKALHPSWQLSQRGGIAIVPLASVVHRVVCLKASSTELYFATPDGMDPIWPLTQSAGDLADQDEAADDDDEDPLSYGSDDDSVDDPYYNARHDDPFFRNLYTDT